MCRPLLVVTLEAAYHRGSRVTWGAAVEAVFREAANKFANG